MTQVTENVVEPQRTAPIGLLVSAITGLRQLVIPIAIGAYTLSDKLGSLGWIVLGLFAILAINIGLASLNWWRLTYTTGAEDIRVESGIVSRAARSVPYERIQDVSLEQKLLPRLFGLVEVKFETGAGGADDLKLAYLTESQGEALRQLIRERREEEVTAVVPDGEEGSAPAIEADSETIFAMDQKRLFKLGLFEFSLAVFAVIGGLAQYAETFVGFEVWDADLWLGIAQSQQGLIEGLGFAGQVISAIAGLLALILIGSATGLIRTFLRDWGFVLEKTARGFRRRRGLVTKTDVVMPTHRVQALVLGTGWLRYRFGWHGLKFVSLAQDAGASNHVVAPFAQMEEIDPIIKAAQFEPPSEDLDWRHASRKYRFDSALIEGGLVGLVAVALAVLVTSGVINGIDFAAFLPLVPLGLAIILVGASLYAWQFQRHTLSESQIFGRKGFLSPKMRIASRTKLHSVEISQGPIAQRRGYATLHLGLAGGSFSIPGLPLERARELKSAIIESMTAQDFSQLK